MTEREELDVTRAWLRSLVRTKRQTGARNATISVQALDRIAGWLDELAESGIVDVERRGGGNRERFALTAREAE